MSSFHVIFEQTDHPFIILRRAMPLLSFLPGRRRSGRNDQPRTNTHQAASESWSNDVPPPPYEPESKFHNHQDKLEKDESLSDGFENATQYTTYYQGFSTDYHGTKGEKSQPHRDQLAQTGPSDSRGPPELKGRNDEELLGHYLPKLAEYDTIILLDDSSSMVCSCGFKQSAKDLSCPSRWEMVSIVAPGSNDLTTY